MINVNNISKYYGDKLAINQLSFTIESGEIVGLLGLNGAGKSTILKMLGCFLMPSEGEASVGGFSIRREPQQVRKMIGYLPDTPPLYGEMTVLSYLSFVARLKSLDKRMLKKLVAESIDKTNLSDVMHLRLSDLSHGYKQRVGIAGALVHNPKVLILDEPINGLDPIQIVEMRDLILSLKGEHTVVLSSHILSEITKTCDRILVIKKGELVAEGREDELRHGAAKANFEIDLQLRGYNEDFLVKLASVDGVLSAEWIEDEAGPWFRLQCQLDQRAQLSRFTVEQGVDLIGLRNKQAELESLFINLLGKES